MFCKYKKLSKFLIYGCFSSFFFMLFFGCASKIKEIKPPMDNIVNQANEEEPALKYNGSLWQDGGHLSELFVNSKAGKVGDIVTIKIVESSSASNKATTNTGKSSSLSMGVDNLFGLEGRYGTGSTKSPHPFFNPFAKIQSGLSNNFDGSGTTTRSGDLTAYITARVTKVLPNGNLEIVGTREVTVNSEEQTITLSGIIRPRDISPDNVILSTYIANAKIAYSGAGIINDRQRPGWMARILDWIWPL